MSTVTIELSNPIVIDGKASNTLTVTQRPLTLKTLIALDKPVIDTDQRGKPLPPRPKTETEQARFLMAFFTNTFESDIDELGVEDFSKVQEAIQPFLETTFQAMTPKKK
jgi:hypothetical protein